MPRPGRKSVIAAVACPNPLHRGSRVKADGKRRSSAGLVQQFRCTPIDGSRHAFSVLVAAAAAESEDTAQREQDLLFAAAGRPPGCPEHGHRGDIVRWGSYAARRGEPRRQRYRCSPRRPEDLQALGKAFHYFTPQLAREHVHVGEHQCEHCGELRGVHKGEPLVARATTWPLAVVAEGLSKLAEGQSYASVSQWAWQLTGRRRTRAAKLSQAEKDRRAAVLAWRAELRARGVNPRGLEPPEQLAAPLPPSRSYQRRRRVDATGAPLPRRRTPSPASARAQARWHTAADWTAAYSGVLWEPLHHRLMERARAEAARRAALDGPARVSDGRPSVLLLDDLPYQSGQVNDGGRRTYRRTYFVLAAGTVTWEVAPDGHQDQTPRPRTQLRLLRGFATNEADSWLLLLDELGYVPGEHEPEFVLADAGTGLRRAIEKFFRTTVLVPSLWHIQHNITEALTKRSGPGALVFTDEGPALHPRLSRLLLDLSAGRLRERGAPGWSRWWDDLATAMDELGLDPSAVATQRSRYEPELAAALPHLAAYPAVPVSTGGFEAVLRARAQKMLAGRSHAFTNLERCAALFDLAVCRDHGLFDDLPEVARQLRADSESRGGWGAAGRVVADPQPPFPATYSTLRDRDLIAELVTARGLVTAGRTGGARTKRRTAANLPLAAPAPNPAPAASAKRAGSAVSTPVPQPRKGGQG
ncbi:MAG: hypothetical protein ACTHQ3_07655 [Motilibacteraceae bacterium]